MYKILKPILVSFLTTTAVKRLIIDILRETICKQTTNTLDDKAVDMLQGYKLINKRKDRTYSILKYESPLLLTEEVA